MYLSARCLVEIILLYLCDILNNMSFSCDGDFMMKSLEEQKWEYEQIEKVI